MSFPVILSLFLVSGLSLMSPPSLRFRKAVHDFGKIPQGKPVTARFRFTNTGTEPLLIQSVEPSCGCTVARYTSEAVAHGRSGWIDLTFNAASVAHFDKQAVVYSNSTTPVTVIYIRGEVVSAAPVSIHFPGRAREAR